MKNSYSQHIFTHVYRIWFPSAANWLFGVAWDGSFAIPAIEGWSPWPKRSSFFDDTSKGITEVKREVQEATSIGSKRTELWALQAIQRQCSCWDRQVCQSPWCGCSSSIFFEETELSCQQNYSTIDQKLLRRGISKTKDQRRRGHCCSSLEKVWKTTTPWSRVGHKGVPVSEEGQRWWRSSVGLNCKSRWSNQACRVWGSYGTQ